MEVEFFDSLEEAQARLHQAMEAADARVKPWQAAVKVGDCFIADGGEEDLVVFGEVLEGYTEAHLRHYRFCRCFSVACPEGEVGDVHVSTVLCLVSRAFFEAMRQEGWQMDGGAAAPSACRMDEEGGWFNLRGVFNGAEKEGARASPLDCLGSPHHAAPRGAEAWMATSLHGANGCATARQNNFGSAGTESFITQKPPLVKRTKEDFWEGKAFWMGRLLRQGASGGGRAGITARPASQDVAAPRACPGGEPLPGRLTASSSAATCRIPRSRSSAPRRPRACRSPSPKDRDGRAGL